MRTALVDLQGRTETFKGTISSFGITRNGKNYICIKDPQWKNQIISDHVWISSCDITIHSDTEFRLGDMIEFDAKVKDYVRKNGTQDIGLEKVHNVKNLTNPREIPQEVLNAAENRLKTAGYNPYYLFPGDLTFIEEKSGDLYTFRNIGELSDFVEQVAPPDPKIGVSADHIAAKTLCDPVKLHELAIKTQDKSAYRAILRNKATTNITAEYISRKSDDSSVQRDIERRKRRINNELER